MALEKTTETQSSNLQQEYSSNNEKHHAISASEQHNDRNRNTEQGSDGKAGGEEHDEKEAGFGDYSVSLCLPIDHVSS